MPFGFVGFKAPIPWFTDVNPWPFWSGAAHGKLVASGAPQHVLKGGACHRGYNLNLSDPNSITANSGNGRAQRDGGNTPLTIGGILNASAAQIASAAAFQKSNRYDD